MSFCDADCVFEVEGNCLLGREIIKHVIDDQIVKTQDGVLQVTFGVWYCPPNDLHNDDIVNNWVEGLHDKFSEWIDSFVDLKFFFIRWVSCVLKLSTNSSNCLKIPCIFMPSFRYQLQEMGSLFCSTWGTIQLSLLSLSWLLFLSGELEILLVPWAGGKENASSLFFFLDKSF